MIHVGVVGSRRRDDDGDMTKLTDFLLEKGWLDSEKVMLVSGGCKTGADNFAEIIARTCGIPITIFYPDYQKWGKPATFKRNSKIAEKCDVLIALPTPDRTGGTEDTIKKAEKLNKEIVLL